MSTIWCPPLSTCFCQLLLCFVCLQHLMQQHNKSQWNSVDDRQIELNKLKCQTVNNHSRAGTMKSGGQSTSNINSLCSPPSVRLAPADFFNLHAVETCTLFKVRLLEWAFDSVRTLIKLFHSCQRLGNKATCSEKGADLSHWKPEMVKHIFQRASQKCTSATSFSIQHMSVFKYTAISNII